MNSNPRIIRVAVVSYHFTPDGAGRPNHVAQALRMMPFLHGVHLVASNYDHIRKSIAPADDMLRLPVRPYALNISFQRILSYFDFARQVHRARPVIEADLVYVCVPDYLAALAVLRSKRAAGYKVIVDVVDLWPEAFPLPPYVNGLVKGVFNAFLKPLRRYLFREADLILFQSRYFLQQFAANSRRSRFLPMCVTGKATMGKSQLRVPIIEEVRMLFLGSINSITDIESLSAMLRLLALRRKVSLCVVGGGVGLESLRQRLAGTTVNVIVRGITFDRGVREEEIARAHFGYNGYKTTTEVAVSYKALDYLQRGLPIINGTKGDLRDLVKSSHCGLNFEPDGLPALVEKILLLSGAEHQRMGENACRAFEENFSFAQFNATLEGYVKNIVGTGPEASHG